MNEPPAGVPADLWEDLCRFVTPEFLWEWVNRPAMAFGLRTPIQVIADGESDLIKRMIYYCNSSDAN